MKSVKLFYLTHCPYCVKAKQAIAELHAENPEYEKIQIERINEEEHPEIAKQFDYYYVPTIFSVLKSCTRRSRDRIMRKSRTASEKHLTVFWKTLGKLK